MKRSGLFRRPIRVSLSNRLALLFAAITLLAFAVLYVYVAPGLQSRLLNDQLAQLSGDAQTHSRAIARTVGSSEPLSTVQDRVNAAALASGDRVTLLLVSQVPGGTQLSTLADSSWASWRCIALNATASCPSSSPESTRIGCSKSPAATFSAASSSRLTRWASARAIR